LGRIRDTNLRDVFSECGFDRDRYFDGHVPNDALNRGKKITFRGGDGRKGKPWAVYGAAL